MRRPKIFGDDPRIAEVIGGPITSPYVNGGDALMQAVLATNPDPTAKGRACLGLAEYAKGCAELVGSLESDPATVNGMAAMLGRERLDAIRSKGRAGWEQEAEGYYRRVVAEFPDGKHYRGTLGQAAESALFEMQNLAIGKPAPEIVGEDLNGKPMKLSDYRGKVVVLDFWGDW